MKSKRFQINQNWEADSVQQQKQLKFSKLIISADTLYNSMEVCFGDPEEEEDNLAYSILLSV